MMTVWQDAEMRGRIKGCALFIPSAHRSYFWCAQNPSVDCLNVNMRSSERVLPNGRSGVAERR
jgi:hypothetical protein